MSALEKKLDVLIAEQDHIRPQDVTLEHIQKVRDSNTNVNCDFSTHYGGYNKSGKRVLTAAQASEMIRAAYRFLGRFARREPPAR
jgi:hypothetical protein